jgi:hypothetical protein
MVELGTYHAKEEVGSTLVRPNEFHLEIGGGKDPSNTPCHRCLNLCLKLVGVIASLSDHGGVIQAGNQNE